MENKDGDENTGRELTAESLYAAAARAETDDAGLDPRLKRFTAWPASKALEPLPPIEWIVKDLLGPGIVGIFVGESGSKKTWSCLDLAVKVALGSKWLDFQTTKSPVLFINEEMGERFFLERLARCLRGSYADKESDLPLFYTCLAGFNFREVNNQGENPDGNHAEILRSLILQTGAKLVIIDSLTVITAGADENSSKEMYPPIHVLRVLASETGCCILIIHHTNKAGGYRGSSSLKDHVDFMYLVASKNESSNIDFSIEKQWHDSPRKFSALANFAPEQFWLSPSEKQEIVTLSKGQEFVLRFLISKGKAFVENICSSADICSPSVARTAIYQLVKMDFIQRTNQGERGAEAEYSPTQKGKEFFNNSL